MQMLNILCSTKYQFILTQFGRDLVKLSGLFCEALHKLCWVCRNFPVNISNIGISIIFMVPFSSYKKAQLIWKSFFDILFSKELGGF